MKCLYLAASLALLMAPAAAPAKTGKSDQGQKIEQAGQAARATKEKKICLTYEGVTGSRLTTTECKTKEKWAREGVDVDELTKS